VLRQSHGRGKFNPSGAGTGDYYGAEFVVDGLAISYQFKIWEKVAKDGGSSHHTERSREAKRALSRRP
jgi:hypothetical protein